MEYLVKDSDSIERIAAAHDCTVGELMKMNRLSSRMVSVTLYVYSTYSDIYHIPSIIRILNMDSF